MVIAPREPHQHVHHSSNFLPFEDSDIANFEKHYNENVEATWKYSMYVCNRDQRLVGMRHWVMHLFCPVSRGRTVGVLRRGNCFLSHE